MYIHSHAHVLGTIQFGHNQREKPSPPPSSQCLPISVGSIPFGRCVLSIEAGWKQAHKVLILPFHDRYGQDRRTDDMTERNGTRAATETNPRPPLTSYR